MPAAGDAATSMLLLLLLLPLPPLLLLLPALSGDGAAVAATGNSEVEVTGVEVPLLVLTRTTQPLFRHPLSVRR